MDKVLTIDKIALVYKVSVRYTCFLKPTQEALWKKLLHL